MRSQIKFGKKKMSGLSLCIMPNKIILIIQKLTKIINPVKNMTFPKLILIKVGAPSCLVHHHNHLNNTM